MKYIDLFEKISPEMIANCDQVVHPDIRFKDPFNDIVGINLFKKMMFQSLKDVKDPCFLITDQARSEKVHYVRWTFSGVVKVLGNWEIEGMSALTYDNQERVIEHIDFWDASEYFYQKIPLVGWPISCLKKRLQVS